MAKEIIKYLKRPDFNQELEKVFNDKTLDIQGLKNKNIDTYVFFSYQDQKGNTIKLICPN